MSIIGSNVLAGAAGSGVSAYEIEQSLRFNSADSAYLNRTPSSAGNQKTWTFSVWLKRSQLKQVGIFCPVTGGDGSNESQMRIKTDNKFQVYDSGAAVMNRSSLQLFRDPSAWFHLVVAVDTTQATDTNRVKIYVNGSQIEASDLLPGQNDNLGWNNTSRHDIGRYAAGAEDYFDGYMAEMHHIDGTQLDPDSFGESDDNGVWRPIQTSGLTYGTNGFYLKFDPSATNGIGHDHSGNGNNFTANNFTTSGTGTDVMSDTPTTNWCTLNPLSFGPSNADMVEGNLRFNQPTSSTGNAKGTIAVSSGKWYWEVTPQTTATANVAGGILGAAETSTSSQPGNYATGYSYYSTGETRHNGVDATYGDSYGADDVIGTALDLDAGTLVFYKNGVSQGTAYSSVSGTFVPAIGDTSTGSGSQLVCNFGQRDFEYTPPTGFKALNTSNLPAPTIKDGSKNFNTVTYAGNGGSNTITTGMDHSSGGGLLWIKNRSTTANHDVLDNVRGLDQLLELPSTAAEYTANVNLAATSTGYTLNTSSGQFNSSGYNYVAWNWLAGGSGSSNTDGTATNTVTVSASPTAGFSIVTYSGQSTNFTWGHGLGVPPSMVIIKGRTNTAGWSVYHSALGATKRLALNTTDAAETMSYFQNTEPTSTVFSVTTNGGTGANGVDYIAYCFAEVEGYSKFGSYVGNNSSDGPFVYCGFKPAFVMVKSYSSGHAYNWVILDAARDPYNVMYHQQYPNEAYADSTGVSTVVDFLSNGFKWRYGANGFNGSSVSYIFAAFSENPFGGSGVSPATAR